MRRRVPGDRVIRDYMKALHETASHGDASEPSFYGSLKAFLLAWAEAEGLSDIDVTTLPKQTEGGNPDFRVWNGRDRITGYIEAKPPTEEHLDVVETSEQLKRYRETFPNLILTNFFEFRLYRNGELVDRVLTARPFVLHTLKAPPPVENGPELLELLGKFFSFSAPPSYTAESLAVELAKRTRFLRDLVIAELGDEEPCGEGDLLGFFEAFRQYLIGHLDLQEFADLYAQTVTYGLFAARTRAREDFNRRTAFENIPRTIGILRDLFRFISLGDLPAQIEWTVDDIAHVLALADTGAILDRYYRDDKGSDPVVHFYETFLAQYDPEERERRGVYYTPEEVVSYIVRSLHGLLKDDFGMGDGLASEGVTLLDPAAGTMTFVARACREAVREFEGKYGAGGREEFIRSHVLKNFYAFELMMAPYAVGHLKMGFFLDELGHHLEPDERFRFYLTNTLEMEDLAQTHFPGMASLAEESRLAGHVKKKEPILVILGNPPYSGHSANKGDWIRARIDDYKQVDGKPLDERNPKWLQDDYVKFLRFAQWKIDQAGRGVVGMITNHSYLDNPTFRGMRQSLMRSFDEIRVLDLHGNSLKREKCPDGSADENVFDIRQGVAVAFFIKRGTGTSPLTPTLSQGERETISPLPPGGGQGEGYTLNSPLPAGGLSNSPLPSGGGQGEGHAPIPRDILDRARRMRKNPSDAESLLWYLVRRRNLGGLKFRRQHAIGRYILDFYCHEARLAVEVDGEQHGEPTHRTYDQARERELQDQGIAVVRLWNRDVLTNTEAAVEYLWQVASARLAGDFTLSRTLSPTLSQRERGTGTQGERETNSPLPAGGPCNSPLPAGGLSNSPLPPGGGQGEGYTLNSPLPPGGLSNSPLPAGGGQGEGSLCRVFHSDLWGLRQAKYDWLTGHDLAATHWQEIHPKTPFYLFVPRDEAALEHYNQFARVTDIFPVNVMGIQTHRDRFVIDFDRDKLERRIRQFLDPNLPDEVIRRTFNLKDTGSWGVGEARARLGQAEDWQDRIVPIQYRPFDTRWVIYHPAVVDRGRDNIMSHMLSIANLAFLISRRSSGDWQHCFVAARMAVDVGISAGSREANQFFPMLVSPDIPRGDLFADRAKEALAEPNLHPALLSSLTQAYGEQPAPEEVFHYVYAVLYAPSYREKYAQFLKTDFPRIPFTPDPELFGELAALGKRLVDLHLLRSDELDPPLARFEGEGDNRVAPTSGKGFRYDEETERVCINKAQCFAPVPAELWEYRIGGYQVLQKWLKDRKDRRLSMEEIKTYCRIVTALAKTVAIQEEIDALYPEAEKDIIPLHLGD